jgi:hypothetical protein
MLAGAIESVAVPADTVTFADRITPFSVAVTVAVDGVPLHAASRKTEPWISPAGINRVVDPVKESALPV